jgi:type IV secretion system protein TrbI
VVSEPNRISVDHDSVAAFRLRSEGPPVMRLSRKVLTGLIGVGATLVFGAFMFALHQDSGTSGGGCDLSGGTDHKPPPESLSALPSDYTMVTQRSAPENPRPIPVAPSGPIPVPPVSGTEEVDADQQHLAQEAEAARTSHLFATTGSSRSAPGGPSDSAPGGPLGFAPSGPSGSGRDQKTSVNGQAEGTPPLDPGSLQNMQDRKYASANSAVDHKTVSPDHLENPASRYVVQTGTIIPAALITGIRSDLPGQVTAQVTE